MSAMAPHEYVYRILQQVKVLGSFTPSLLVWRVPSAAGEASVLWEKSGILMGTRLNTYG